jgi:hypothetical protein
MNDVPKVKKHMFRASIIYTGKHLGKTECAFVKAITKEAASKFIEDSMKLSMKKYGWADDCYKIEISPSSKEEMEFYLENKSYKNYTGLVN